MNFPILHWWICHISPLYIAIPFCSPLRSCSKAPRGVGLQVGHPGWGKKWSPQVFLEPNLQASKVKIRCIFTYGKCTLTQICFLSPPSLSLSTSTFASIYICIDWLIFWLSDLVVYIDVYIYLNISWYHIDNVYIIWVFECISIIAYLYIYLL